MNCHICKQNTSGFIHPKIEILYYHCKDCECIFKSPRYYQDLSTQKKRYDLHQNNDDDLKYISYFQKFVDFTLSSISPPKNALDFGCGRSIALSKLIEDNKITCDYYDPIYHPKNIIKKYDLITCVEVFEHLHQPLEVFEKLLSYLHDGGYLAIQTAFHTNNQEEFEKWYYPNDPTHIVFFRPKTFEVLAKKYYCTYVKDNNKNMILLQKKSAFL